ncbi:MAG: class I SAM-dependent methyltransferase [Burkholderiales bacterium]|nr:class I SAM-dependent methyltransferase [Burkholderiales bacterium]
MTSSFPPPASSEVAKPPWRECGTSLERPGPAGDRAWRALRDAAAAPYRPAGRFAWHFARGKLRHDPVFRALLERGTLHGARVVDIGCGQGLLASLLQACADIERAGLWPAHWARAPRATRYLGIELMARDVARADAALGRLALAPRVTCADMRCAALPPCDLVVMLDVLHYVDPEAQGALLARVRDALRAGGGSGRLVLRIGDAARRRGYAASQWVDRVVTWSRGHRVAPTFGRPLADWVALLHSLGFAVRTLPMSRGTPFANVLLSADLASTDLARAAHD